MSTRLETKPGASLTATGVLPSFLAQIHRGVKVASLVCSARITSTSTITGTGFMKCMPINRSGRLVSAASVVMAIEDVLLAMITSSRSRWSASVSTWRLISSFSGTASTRKSAFATVDISVTGTNAAQHRSLLRFRQLALLNFAIEILGYRVHAAVEVALLDIAQDHLVAGARENVRDAVAHGARAQHRDGFNMIDRQEKRLLPQRMRTKYMEARECIGDRRGSSSYPQRRPLQMLFRGFSFGNFADDFSRSRLVLRQHENIAEPVATIQSTVN